MADSRVPNSLGAVDAAYIAGLIDGEGTITLTRKHRNWLHPPATRKRPCRTSSLLSSRDTAQRCHASRGAPRRDHVTSR